MLWGDDYVKYNTYLQLGNALLLSGAFKQRMYKAEYEFKLNSIILAENIKKAFTKQLQLELNARNLHEGHVNFLDENINKFPGNAGLKLLLTDPKENLKIGLSTLDRGFEMNHEMVAYLENTPEIEVSVSTIQLG